VSGIKFAAARSLRVVFPKAMARRAVRHELACGEPELALIPVLCDKDHDFVDVGANLGVYSVHAQRFARSVLAFEPHPHVARRLRRILSHGAVREIALSDHSGTADLSIPVLWGGDVDTRSSLEGDANPGFELRSVTVKLERLDDIRTSKIGVMKVDVEGHELAVVEGATATLIRDRPTVIIECEERHHTGGVRALQAKFEELGYDGHFIHRGSVRPIRDFAPETFQLVDNALRVGGPRSPDYVNNFIFIHPERNRHLDSIKARLAG
jgi:FkbM family methyltransferase